MVSIGQYMLLFPFFFPSWESVEMVRWLHAGSLQLWYDEWGHSSIHLDSEKAPVSLANNMSIVPLLCLCVCVRTFTRLTESL